MGRKGGHVRLWSQRLAMLPRGVRRTREDVSEQAGRGVPHGGRVGGMAGLDAVHERVV